MNVDGWTKSSCASDAQHIRASKEPTSGISMSCFVLPIHFFILIITTAFSPSTLHQPNHQQQPIHQPRCSSPPSSSPSRLPPLPPSWASAPLAAPSAHLATPRCAARSPSMASPTLLATLVSRHLRYICTPDNDTDFQSSFQQPDQRLGLPVHVRLFWYRGSVLPAPCGKITTSCPEELERERLTVP